MILVTSATGNIGRALVRELHDSGHPVRAATRSPHRAVFPSGVEVVHGDLDDPASFREAFAGVTGFLLLGAPGDVPGLLRTAARAGVRRVVLVSSLLAETHPDSVIGRGALSGEEIVRDSGLEWTVLRPWEFASNAFWWAPSIREHGSVHSHEVPEGSQVVDPADIAAVAARALTEPGHEQRIHPLTGSERLTVAQRVAVLSEELARPIEFVELSTEQARQRMLRYMPAGIVEDMLSTSGKDPGVLDTVREITGAPARTFRQWARRNIAAFG
ncbi:NAD(P)H-binding protein [Actinopolyspora mortivallis]|nr:NAD(P)H-binding protein [Actinopolyspora mortivallis]